MTGIADIRPCSSAVCTNASLCCDRSIDVRTSRLRHQIEQDLKDPKLIKIVYGAGIIFATQVTWLDKDD